MKTGFLEIKDEFSKLCIKAEVDPKYATFIDEIEGNVSAILGINHFD
jgi:hypothetical protein